MSTYSNQAYNCQTTFNTVRILSAYNSYHNGYHESPHSYPSSYGDLQGLTIVLEGERFLEKRDGETIHLLPGDAYFYPFTSVNKTYSTEKSQVITYWFYSQGIEIPVNKLMHIDLANAQVESLEADKIILLLQTQNPAKMQYANSYFCCRILKLIEDNNELAEKTMTIDDFILYINAHVEEPLTVRTLASAFHYTPKHVYHLFCKILGTTPKQFILSVKLQYACHLLDMTDITLAEIAKKLYFSSVSHLINTFKKQYGLTPSAYRKRHLQ